LARIAVTVSPGASRTRLLGRHGDGWKARVTEPPEHGRANDALIALLAKRLGVKRSRLTLVAGKTGTAQNRRGGRARRRRDRTPATELDPAEGMRRKKRRPGRCYRAANAVGPGL
jgi:uncharacterized protein YggU (UPF0235/DUF167 family)